MHNATGTSVSPFLQFSRADWTLQRGRKACSYSSACSQPALPQPSPALTTQHQPGKRLTASDTRCQQQSQA